MGVMVVLSENRRKAPVLELAEASNNTTGTMLCKELDLIFAYVQRMSRNLLCLCCSELEVDDSACPVEF